MKKEIIVISLGGSLIIPENIEVSFLRAIREVIKLNLNKYKFVIVCGGGSPARKYIEALKEDKKSEYLQSLIGISVTRLNARFMAYFFGKDPEWGIPHDMKHVKNLLEKEDIVFCGGLRYAPNQTSDATACRLAAYLKSKFLNLTNVKGLYTKNPIKYKDAKFIAKTTRENLAKIVYAIPQRPGMHAPVDHTAMKVILKHNLSVYILGKDAKQLDNFLRKREFIGTIIE